MYFLFFSLDLDLCKSRKTHHISVVQSIQSIAQLARGKLRKNIPVCTRFPGSNLLAQKNREREENDQFFSHDLHVRTMLVQGLFSRGNQTHTHTQMSIQTAIETRYIALARLHINHWRRRQCGSEARLGRRNFHLRCPSVPRSFGNYRVLRAPSTLP